MDIANVRERVATIAGQTGDSEQAHGAEDRLYVELLRAIADGTAEQPQEMARIALTVDDMDFERWYA